MNSLHGLPDHSLVRRIAAAPCLYEGEARTRVAERFAEIAGVPAGQTLARLCATSPKLEALLAGLVACAPHLWDLVLASPHRLIAFLVTLPKDFLPGILSLTDHANFRM